MLTWSCPVFLVSLTDILHNAFSESEKNSKGSLGAKIYQKLEKCKSYQQLPALSNFLLRRKKMVKVGSL